MCLKTLSFSSVFSCTRDWGEHWARNPEARAIYKKKCLFSNNLLSFKSINIKPLTKQCSANLSRWVKSDTRKARTWHCPSRMDWSPGWERKEGKMSRSQMWRNCWMSYIKHDLKGKLHGKKIKWSVSFPGLYACVSVCVLT